MKSTICFILLGTSLGLVASLATAQSLPCDPQHGACVRELPPEQGSVTAQESWTQDMHPDPGSGAWVREVPEDYVPPAPAVEWGWTPLDIPYDMPPSDPVAAMCARSPEQALSWMMGPAYSQDETILNRAVTAYDWRGQSAGTAERLIDWMAAWPAGGWEQQTAWEGGNERYVQRYRYVATEGQVHTWMRAAKSQGCWFLRSSPPKEPEPEPMAPQGSHSYPEAQAPHEGTQEAGNLQILWEAPPSG